MAYERITPLPYGVTDREAVSVESLREAWIEQRNSLVESGALGSFNDRLIRRWAIETGMIERIYALDRCTTEILVAQGLRAALIEHGASDLPAAELATILNDHREAAAYVIDHVAGDVGLSLHFVRSLHGLLTRHQADIEAEDQFGRLMHVPLLRGQWKELPNNPRRPDGTIHEYCPPALVQKEMEALIQLHGELAGMDVPAVIRAAWSHHRFTQIHPFQDGNGRVARALAMFVFVKDEGFPIVVDRDVRTDYIDALERADAGELQPLVRLFARLEKKELETALSLSETAVVRPGPIGGATMREKLLEALRDRARDKRESVSARRKGVVEKGLKAFASVAKPAARELCVAVNEILRTELPGSRIDLQQSGTGTRHYFKTQVVAIAQREGYYCDLDTLHEWLRLRSQRPGDAETSVSEIVVSLHSVGRQFTGVLALTAYYATRFLDEDGRSVTLQPHPLASRSLTFSYLEDQANIEARIDEWLGKALNLGIEHLRRSL